MWLVFLHDSPCQPPSKVTSCIETSHARIKGSIAVPSQTSTGSRSVNERQPTVLQATFTHQSVSVHACDIYFASVHLGYIINTIATLGVHLSHIPRLIYKIIKTMRNNMPALWYVAANFAGNLKTSKGYSACWLLFLPKSILPLHVKQGQKRCSKSHLYLKGFFKILTFYDDFSNENNSTILKILNIIDLKDGMLHIYMYINPYAAGC